MKNKSQLTIHSKFNNDHLISFYFGNCLKFLKTIPDESVQLVVTSPPYNIGKEYEEKLNIDDYVYQQNQVIAECARILKKEGSICWEVGNYVNNGDIIPLDILLYDSFINNSLKLRNRIIWHFGHGLHCTNRFSGRYETIIWFTKSNDYYFNLDAVRIPQKYPGKKHFKGPKKGEYSGNPKGKNPSDVWDIPNVKSNHVEKTCHPCQFPIVLIQRLISSLTKENDIVFDPFMGVGTVAIAALINNRKAAGAEINKKYYKIACNRINKAYKGELKIRPDKPVYEPKSDNYLLKNPFIEEREANGNNRKVLSSYW